MITTKFTNDPLKKGFYYVEYTYMNRNLKAVYFELESAQEAMIKMIQRGVICNGLHEWKDNF
jgi:hypothetical protein